MSETDIREWFERHKHDRCTHLECRSGPPNIWASHFQWLLDSVADWRGRAGRQYDENVHLIAENTRLQRLLLASDPLHFPPERLHGREFPDKDDG